MSHDDHQIHPTGNESQAKATIIIRRLDKIETTADSSGNSN
ncbi:hypothetical protein ACFFWE_28145 [Sphaerisporangium melleum]|nr:hypothetical protein [Sphaerisporangium melleum]